jgi:acyl-CoA thioesterase FadM
MTIRELLERIGLLDPKPEGIEAMALACTDKAGHVSRRAFFGLMGTALIAAGIDPEKLLWTPGETGIVLPTAAETATYSHVLVTPDWMVKEIARLLDQNLRFAARVNRAHAQMFKVGHEVLIKRADPRPVTITDQLQVTVPAETMQKRIEQGATSDELRREFLAPAAAELTRMARERNLDTFVPLELPTYVRRAVNVQKMDGDGVPVRGILAEDLSELGAPVTMRFDILGGSTQPREREGLADMFGEWDDEDDDA